MRHEYSNGELTIIWQPQKCTHSGICIRLLPGVYRPQKHPWIQISRATTAEFIAQINHCPSGALSYRLEQK